MKVRLLTLAIIMLFGSSALAQTTPFKYKNVRAEKSERKGFSLDDLRKLKDSIDKIPPKIDTSKLDDVVVVVKRKKKTYSYYSLIAARFTTVAEKKEKEINELFAIKRSEILSRLTTSIDKKGIKNCKEELEELEEEMNKEKKFVADLKTDAKEMAYKGRSLSQLQLFPVRNSTDAQLYYDYYSSDKKARFLKNTLITFSPDGGKASIYNELFGDYFGPVRFGLGALVSNTETNTTTDANGNKTIDSSNMQNDAVQRLLGGGGNVVFNFSYPLFGYTSSSQNIAFKLLLAPKASFDAPKLGTSNDNYSANLDLGLEGSLFYTGVLDILTLYGNFRFSRISGNDNFYTNLVKPDQKAFSFNQTSLGIALNSTFRISWNYYWGSSFVTNNFPSNISFSIVPN